MDPLLTLLRLSDLRWAAAASPYEFPLHLTHPFPDLELPLISAWVPHTPMGHCGSPTEILMSHGQPLKGGLDFLQGEDEEEQLHI